MNSLFKDLTPASVIYALIKGDDVKYIEGSIVSVSQPRMNMPDMKMGQLPTMQNVVDVTYSLDGKNYTDTVDTTASMFSTKNTGALTLISTDKESVVRELHATLKTSENYIKESEREVPRQKKRIKDCKTLIMQLDTDFKEKQQTEERFAKLEETQKEQGGKLDEILSLLRDNRKAL
ncbi:hypothetical protein [Prevotella sp. E2-28]|uniref:hypothetical protein n=1 Tax=Prevotella sp. E2-28 TaxID=2913620 RepID=UPI001EDAB048|nr:hypothetical protein [Prevotella sp. E2-28]UKK52678.1 hypothetical protein L6465_08680 [Prevotella sp. E2-28]